MNSRQRIKEEFTYYLSNLVKSSRAIDGEYKLKKTSVNSYLTFLEVNKLFDYDENKSKVIKAKYNITSMYDITSEEEICDIAEELLKDKDFIKRDKENNNWRSCSLIYYVCFIKTRSYFLNKKTQEPSNSSDIKNKNKINNDVNYSTYRPYITAIKSKPFLLLAGISGTGKSRIVRELARACWEKDSEEYKAQKPKNFQMVQVKPNWHDSSDLLGYVSRVSGKAEFVAGDFLKFIAKAWENIDTPYFLCLDEMNLAPVEQYFAEYLSVIESRKCCEDGTITTDPILEKSLEDWYRVLTIDLTNNDDVRDRFLKDGICIPQNLIVVGTVNMDETTFSFSRKVLDRAMTIEMNEVNLHGGLTERYELIGKLGKAELIGEAVEGIDLYADNKEVCDIVLNYLEEVNNVLENTPFKVAYRTRNEFLLYVVNNLPYNKDEEDNELTDKYIIARALDEITSMKVLSRIEGDDIKVSDAFLDKLSNTIKEKLEEIAGEEKEDIGSISLKKLKEMKAKLVSGHTSFWS